MKRTTLVIAVLLVLLVPASLYAQEELTLEKVFEAVKGMQSDFSIFALELRRVNERIDTTEARLTALEESQQVQVQMGTGDEPCILINSAGTYGIEGHQLRPETQNAFLNKFGTAVESVIVKYARYIPKEDVLEVRYEPVMSWGDDTVIIERWQQCKFLGFEVDLD